jgi:hypothetical protein
MKLLISALLAMLSLAATLSVGAASQNDSTVPATAPAR